MTNANMDIPNFDNTQYMEAKESRATLEPLNYEPIYFRSNAYDWEIKPHRHSSLYQIFLLNKGAFLIKLDDKQGLYKAPTLLVIPPMCVHGFEYEKESDGHVFSIFQSVLSEFLPFHKKFAEQLEHPIIINGELFTSQLTEIENIFSKIKDEFYGMNPGRLQVLQSQISYLFIMIMRLSKHGIVSRPSYDHAEERLAQRFKELVEIYFSQHKTNDFYASELGISTSKLVAISNDILGTPPQKQAHDRLILEAKRNLIYTNKPSSNIAHILGFGDPAYFSRFFKKITGETPSHFRRTYIK